MELKLFTVDSFSDRPFAGNPAAVCLVRRDLSERLDDATMTKIAAEINLSETAFVAEDAASPSRTVQSSICAGLRPRAR